MESDQTHVPGLASEKSPESKLLWWKKDCLGAKEFWGAGEGGAFLRFPRKYPQCSSHFLGSAQEGHHLLFKLLSPIGVCDHG